MLKGGGAVTALLFAVSTNSLGTSVRRRGGAPALMLRPATLISCTTEFPCLNLELLKNLDLMDALGSDSGVTYEPASARPFLELLKPRPNGPFHFDSCFPGVLCGFRFCNSLDLIPGAFGGEGLNILCAALPTFLPTFANALRAARLVLDTILLVLDAIEDPG